MGFFHIGARFEKTSVYGLHTEFLHRNGCRVCPLRDIPDNQHPDMQPHGSDTPLVYMLGEAPGREEDKAGMPFVGIAGQTLRFRIPDEWIEHIRMSNVVRTRPPKNKTPDDMMLECCRPSVIADIEKTRPKAIFAFGGTALKWALKQSRITSWNGRRVPVQIGEHKCWLYPMLHPSYINRTNNYTPTRVNDYGSEIDFVFARDLKKAFAEVDDLPEPVIHSNADAMAGIEIVTGANGWNDVAQIKEWLDHTIELGLCGFDYETNMLRPYHTNAKILSVAIANENGVLAFPLDHPGQEFSVEQMAAVEEALADFLHHPKVNKVVHNLAFEMEWSAFFYDTSCLRAGTWEDTLGQAYLLDERRGTHSLDFLCLQHFGINLKAISNIDTKYLEQTKLDLVLRYNGLDAKYHLMLHELQMDELEKRGMTAVYDAHLRRIPALVLTQIKGVPIDQDVVAGYANEFNAELDAICDEIEALPEVQTFLDRGTFKPGSSRHIGEVLQTAGFDLEEKDEDGNSFKPPKFATSEELLAQVEHPLAKLILRWREITKLLSTYIEPLLPERDNSVLFPDGRIHPIYNTAATRTWRTSAESPNVQNYPKHEHSEIRRVVRDETMVIVPFDYSGIQARNIAMESRDAAMMALFWDRYDVHSDWMENIRRLHPRWMSKADYDDAEQRKYFRNRAKNGLVFPSFFGAGAAKVAGELGIPEEIAAELQELFWAKFPEVKRWQDGLKHFYRRHGYITGLSGHRRHAPIGITELINAPIQADEALIVVNAMAKLSELEEDRFQPNLEIHDDLTFIWPKHEVERNAETVITKMLEIDFDWINVPLGVEMSVGDDWSNVKKAEEHFSDEWGLGPQRNGG